MVREFAGIIAETTGVPTEGAEKMAQYFLSPHKHGLYVDYLGHLQHLLTRWDGKFVTGLYQLLLNREETPQELAEGVHQLKQGVARGSLIQKLVTCEEAKQLGLPTASWLTQAMAGGRCRSGANKRDCCRFLPRRRRADLELYVRSCSAWPWSVRWPGI